MTLVNITLKLTHEKKPLLEKPFIHSDILTFGALRILELKYKIRLMKLKGYTKITTILVSINGDPDPTLCLILII